MRMGRPKQLLPVRGEPAVALCCRSILAGGVNEVVVAVGHHGDRVRRALEGIPVGVVENPDPDSGMIGSVRVGLSALPPPATGVLVCLCDHPLVQPETFHTLLVKHQQQPDQILVPVHDGRGGHPTLFPRDVLCSLGPCATLRDAILAHGQSVQRFPVDDPGVILDMDTEEDYRRLASMENGPPRWRREGTGTPFALHGGRAAPAAPRAGPSVGPLCGFRPPGPAALRSSRVERRQAVDPGRRVASRR